MSAPLSPARTVALVARREFRSRASTKAFLVSNLVVLVVLLVGIVAASAFGGDDDPRRVGLAEAASDLGPAVLAAADALALDVRTEPVEPAAARDAVTGGDLEVVLLPGEAGGVTAVTAGALDPALQAALETAVRQTATDAALDELGVDPQALADAVAGAVVTVDAVDPPDPAAGERTALASLSLFLLFFQIFLFGIYVATGVVEEKASRVVEVLLATVKPLHLLAGKVVGIGAVGLLQLTAYGVVGVGAATATGLIGISGTAWAVFATTLAWFVLGFAFFAVLYAAAASLVSRQEDVNSTTTPINLLAFACLFAAQFAISDPDGGLVRALAWVPPFSTTLMPLRVAAGDASAVQVVGTVLLMLVATAAAAVLAARVYERSVLRTGSTTGWRDVVALARRDRRDVVALARR